MEPIAQTQNLAASSGFLPLALATKAHPPKTVLCRPLGGKGRGKTPYWKSLLDVSLDASSGATTKANTEISPRKSALEKATTEGGYSSAPMKLFKDLTLLTGRSEPRVPPEVYKAISDTIQACQLSGADPKQAAEEGSQRIESFLSGYTGAPLL